MKIRFGEIHTCNKDCIKQFTVILMIITAVLCFGCIKYGYYVDEIYSYGLSNSEYAPFLKQVMDGDITGKIITREMLFDYVAAGESRFNYASVYYNQTQDVHPPLYYCILHTLCSLFPNSFSKWLGLIPNLIFFALTLYLLLKMSNDLFGHRTEISLSVITLYGLSTVGLSTVLFIRMYMLMTLLTVLLAYIILKLIQHERYYLYPAVSAVIFMGLTTQYYFVFYVFFICLFYIGYQWKEKRYKNVVIFSLFSLLGAGSLYLVFPDCITQMTKRTGTGTTVVQQLAALDEYVSRCYRLFRSIVHGLFLPGIFGGGVFAALLLNYKKIKVQLRHIRKTDAMIIVIPAFLATLAVICISTPNIRYIYNLMPFYVLLVGYLLFVFKSVNIINDHRVKKWIGKGFLPMMICSGIFIAFILKPSFLYEEYKQYDQLIKAYKKCVYISDNINPCITSDLCQLLNFDEVFVSNVSNISAEYEDVCDYIKSTEETVVYIAEYKNIYSCDEVINVLLKNMHDHEIEKLYEGDFSVTYLLKRKTS